MQLHVNVDRMPLASADFGFVRVELKPLLVVLAHNILQHVHREAMILYQIINITIAMLIKSIVLVVPEQECQFPAFGL